MSTMMSGEKHIVILYIDTTRLFKGLSPYTAPSQECPEPQTSWSWPAFGHFLPRWRETLFLRVDTPLNWVSYSTINPLSLSDVVVSLFEQDAAAETAAPVHQQQPPSKEKAVESVNKLEDFELDSSDDETVPLQKPVATSTPGKTHIWTDTLGETEACVGFLKCCSLCARDPGEHLKGFVCYTGYTTNYWAGLVNCAVIVSLILLLVTFIYLIYMSTEVCVNQKPSVRGWWGKTPTGQMG